MPDKPGGPWPAVVAIGARMASLDGMERRLLGRWTSSTVRDPKVATALEAARIEAVAAIERDPDRRRRWRAAAGPLHAGLVEGEREARRWRVVMLVAHFAAVAAVASLPGGLAPVVAGGLVALAPVSAILAWGRGLEWLGAINAALAEAAGSSLTVDQHELLRRPWAMTVEASPAVRPPLIGAVASLAPSVLLLVVFSVVLATRIR